MAKHIVGPNSKITVNGTDLSAFASDYAINDAANDVDVTGFGERYTEHLNGIRDASMDMTFFQSYGSSEVDATVGPLYYNDTVGTVKINPDTTGTVVYTLLGKVQTYNPSAGAVGAADTTPVHWVNSSTAGLTRGTV